MLALLKGIFIEHAVMVYYIKNMTPLSFHAFARGELECENVSWTNENSFV